MTRRPPCGSLEDFLRDISEASLEAGTSPNPALKALHCPHTRQKCCQAPANVVSWALSQREAGPCCLSSWADHRERSPNQPAAAPSRRVDGGPGFLRKPHRVDYLLQGEERAVSGPLSSINSRLESGWSRRLPSQPCF